jgi:hypothetical protein
MMTTYTAVQPPAFNSTYVKATSYFNDSYAPYLATHTGLSDTGDFTGTSWDSTASNSQRFHIDLGEAKIARRVYYQNGHSSGAYTGIGANQFTMWGSNSATAFATLTYATDTDWSQLVTGVSNFTQHVAANISDPQYFLVTNIISYRYYAFKFANNWGGAGEMNLRRIALMTEDGFVPPVASGFVPRIMIF